MNIVTVLSAFISTCIAGLTDPFAGQQDIFYSNITEDPAYQTAFNQSQQIPIAEIEPHPKPIVMSFNDKLMQIAPNTFKICTLLSLLVLTFIALVPKCCIKRWRGVGSPLNCFACGVYLSIAMLQMLPQSDSFYDSWALKRNVLYMELQFSYYLIVFGYVLALFADKVVNCQKELTEGKEPLEQTEMTTYTMQTVTIEPIQVNSSAITFDLAPNKVYPLNPLNPMEIDLSPVKKDKEFDVIEQPATNNVTKIQAVLSTLSLCVFAYTEGKDFNLLKDNQTVFKRIIVLIVHRIITTISLGAILANAQLSQCTSVILIITYSISSQVGLLVGLFVQPFSELIHAMLLSVTAGFVIYMCLSSLVVIEFNGKGQLSSLMFLVLGFFCITLVVLFQKLN